jgi:nucleoside-diphosphate-sugar epimerase
MSARKKNGPSILVTGGAGFVGSHLCELLLERGFGVHVVDDLSSGSLSNLPLSSPGLTFERLKIGDPAAEKRLAHAVAGSSMVYHLASPVGVASVHNDPGAAVCRIVLAGAQLVECCRRHQRPILFTSSSEVYGPTPPCPTTEDSPLMLSAASRFSYGVAKLAVEHMVAGLCNQSGVASWIVRLFNVAGPRQRAEAGVIAAFAEELARGGGPLQIHGDGTQTRSFLHVRDAVVALIAVADRPELKGRAVNVGGKEVVSIRSLANQMARQAGGSRSLSHCDYRDCFGENFAPVLRREPDTRLLEGLTGWRSEFRLADIVRDCLEFASRSAKRSASE